MDIPGLKEIFPLVSAPGQRGYEFAVLVQRKTGFRANRSFGECNKQTWLRFTR